MRIRILRLGSVVIAACVLVFAAILIIKGSKFVLSEEFTNSAEISAITTTDLKKLIAEKKSFGVFVSQPNCRAAADFRKVLESFVKNHNLKIFEVDFTELRESGLAPDVKFYPSFIIFREGSIVDSLSASDDNDTEAYTTIDGFESWFTSYVELRN